MCTVPRLGQELKTALDAFDALLELVNGVAVFDEFGLVLPFITGYASRRELDPTQAGQYLDFSLPRRR
jgi:hypothetical protein